ncbi:MAG: TolB protein [Gaiellaceae bacterium]|nr:TolB protein [Gaiellaceae bacterium]
MKISLFAAVVGVSLIAVVGSAGGASSRQNGKFAFVRSSPGSIWSMNADGSGKKALTPHYPYAVVARDDSEPEWSPNGTKIVFTRSRQTTGVSSGEPATEIDVMNANGSNPTRLTRTPLNDRSPTWSPDGAKIAFVRERVLSKTPTSTPRPYGELYVMNADGSGERRLTQVVLDVCNKNTLTGEGDNADATQPAWSPDSARIAFTSTSPQYPCRGEISVINADGSGQRQLTGNGGPNDVQRASNATWSPDGRKIAYQGGTSYFDETTEIWAMNADGSGRTRLTKNDGFCPYKCPNNETHIQPAWAPDGTKIAYTRNIPSKNIDQRDLFDVFTMNPDGSAEKLVVRDIVQRVDWGSIPSGAPNPVPPPPLRVLGHPALTLRCVRGDLSMLVAPRAGIDFVQFYLNGIDLQGGAPHFFNSPPFTTSYPASRLHAKAWTVRAVVSLETESSTIKRVLTKRHAPHC